MIPELKKTHQSTVRFTPERYEVMRKIAYEKDWSFQYIIDKALNSYLNELSQTLQAQPEDIGTDVRSIPRLYCFQSLSTDNLDSTNAKFHEQLNTILLSGRSIITDAIISNLAACEELARHLEAIDIDEELPRTGDDEASFDGLLGRKIEQSKAGRARGAEAGDRALQAKDDIEGTKNGHRHREELDSDEDGKTGAA